MECQSQTSHWWTFNLLVGAFLDLAIAYLLLCGAALAYFTSKFLSFFGLALPCPCNGLFGMPNNSNYCLQRYLVDCPTEKIYNVQWSAKNTFPFNSVIASEQNHELVTNVVNERNEREGHFEMDGKASHNMISNPRKMNDLNVKESSLNNELIGVGVMKSPTWREGRFDHKRKGVSNHRPGSGIRRRKKASCEYVKLSSFGLYDSFQSSVQGISRSSSCINKEIAEESLAYFKSGSADGFNGEVSPSDLVLHEDDSNAFKIDEAASEFNYANRDTSLMEEFMASAEGELGFNNSEENSIRFLKHALEKEHAACDALYLELEKERSAAASAANEAMAMILRLQEEKALIEMEARQYRRMIEEKYAYDVEEMNLLKEIIIRREREKYFLEKEVEAYRQMTIGNEHSNGSFVGSQSRVVFPMSYMSEDPLPMLQQISESIKVKEKMKYRSQIDTLALGKEVPILKWDDDFDEDFQEKGVVSMGEKPCVEHIKVNKRKDCSHSSSSSAGRDNIGLEKDLKQSYEEPKINAANNVVDYTTHNSIPYISDVHVIDDESNLYNESMETTRKWASTDATSNCCDKSVNSSKEFAIEKNNNLGESSRNVSERSSGLPPMSNSRGKSLLSDMRRYSMSAVDYERLKIDNEVEWLRERLRTVQEGREKLNLSVENRETRKTELQLLEDIASQLREIRYLTEPGNAVRQASSKDVSHKRRYRSVSLGVRSSV